MIVSQMGLWAEALAIPFLWGGSLSDVCYHPKCRVTSGRYVHLWSDLLLSYSCACALTV